MDEFDRLEANVANLQLNNQQGRRLYRWSQALYTFSYLFFETICFVSLLSISIGVSALVSVSLEYFIHWELSPFVETYITLFMFMNFACAQARNQALYVYQIRDRFGPHVYCCFYCTYPWSLWFVLLSLAYINLFYQFNQLFCSDANEIGSQGRRGQSLSKLRTLSSTIPELRTTTALFLMSLSSIQYLTCRKLRWDYYMEVAQMPDPPALPSCSAYFTAVFALLFVQTVLAVLYIMPFLLWLLIARLFIWSINATVFSAVVVSILVGYFGSFVERQEPFPSINRNRTFHIVNLKLRTTVVCLVNIPLVSFWFFKAEEQNCLIGLPADSHAASGLDVFNFFLMNICLCILNTVKFSSLSAHARRAHQLEVHNNRLRQENRVRPVEPTPFLDGRDDTIGNGSDRDAMVPASEATVAAPSTSQSKTIIKDVTMDQDGNEVHNKVSSSGLILKKEPQNHDIAKKVSSSRSPIDCSSNAFQVPQALDKINESLLCQMNEHQRKYFNKHKPFCSDHLSLNAVKLAQSESTLVTAGQNLQEKLTKSQAALPKLSKKFQDFEKLHTKTQSKFLATRLLTETHDAKANNFNDTANLSINATSSHLTTEILKENTKPHPQSESFGENSKIDPKFP